MKNILIPVDFSAFSLSAAKTGAFLASKAGSKLHFLHIISGMPVGWHNLSAEVQHQSAELEVKMKETQSKMEKFAQDPQLKSTVAETYIRGGVPFEQIILFAEDRKMDLIVMGVHGAGESDGQFIGSTAQKVVRVASCSVLTVRKSFEPESIRNIMFASDFKEDIQPALGTVKELAANLKATIDLAYINTPDNHVDTQAMEMKMKKYINGQKEVTVNTVIHSNQEREEGLLTCTKERNANLLALVSHLHKKKASYLLDMTEDVIFHSDVPVLSLIN